MATTLTVAGMGFRFRRNQKAASPTFQANLYKIKAGMASKIGRGDLVQTDPANRGYIIPVTAANPAQILGVFDAVLPYFDQNSQQIQFGGPSGNYIPTANPQGDIDCYVIDDPDARFLVQVSGGTWAQSWRGENAQLLAASLANPGISGISTAVLDGTTVGTPSAPIRILEIAHISPNGVPSSSNLGVSAGGGANDPQITNPWVEVQINFSISEFQQAVGI